MNVVEETIDATLDANGGLTLSHLPHLPPGPVRVTIRALSGPGQHRGLADVVRDISAGQRSRGFPGRSAGELNAEDEARLAEDDKRDQQLSDARSRDISRSP